MQSCLLRTSCTAAQVTQQAHTGGLRPVSPAALEPLSPERAHGRISLYDKGGSHEYLGPKVLRDWQRSVGLPPHSPDDYLRQGQGRDLRVRNGLAQWLKRHPIGREPPFRRGQAGVVLDWGSVARPQTIFRYLRDNGTIDFVRVQSGGLQNHVEWGRPVRPGLMSWSRLPSEIAIAKWLPIFLEGIREYEEPYRFLAIRGSESLILDAGPELHAAAADCVPPLRKALESREPTAVAVALELILLALRVDAKVTEVWIYQLWQFAQVMNLFLQKRYTVDLGYNTRELASIRQLIFDTLIMLEENGGEHATALIRRYCRVDPAVTPASQARRADKERQRASGGKPFQAFTLF